MPPPVPSAIGRLEEAIAKVAATGTSTNGSSSPAVPVADEAPLVATMRGTMAHRPECVVVAGKVDLRPVTAADGLAPCKLCAPYAVSVN